MTEMKKLGDCGVQIVTGQIMSRISAKGGFGENPIGTYRVAVPKCIHPDGTVNVEEMPEEELRVQPEKKHTTQAGDIIMKLSGPYDAAVIDECSEGCVVPSFCAIIRDKGELDPQYLLAFLNSRMCKKQLKMKVTGRVMSILSVGKVRDVEIPVPSLETQERIGREFINTRETVNTLREIMEMELMKNDVRFNDLAR